VAVIGLVDEAQDGKKSKYGPQANFTGLPREISICSTTICAGNRRHPESLLFGRPRRRLTRLEPITPP
jgi:hypothetical protein